jgi:hypothetical protein
MLITSVVISSYSFFLSQPNPKKPNMVFPLPKHFTGFNSHAGFIHNLETQEWSENYEARKQNI